VASLGSSSRLLVSKENFFQKLLLYGTHHAVLGVFWSCWSLSSAVRQQLA
jgi:hypothetical protein